jgi:SAM-dependent methyltransferase
MLCGSWVFLRKERNCLRSSIPLYNALAREYEDGFYDAPHRRAYDTLAWEHVSRFLPAHPGLIVDAGCGAGRWVDRLLPLGHQVIGIEPAPEMIKVLERRQYGSRFTLIPQQMEKVAIKTESADVVLAMGSLQYTENPAQMIQRFASWTKPGGIVCVLVDSFVALVLELVHSGKTEEALERLKAARGVWQQQGREADLHLLDRKMLESHFAAAGLTDVLCRGLLVTASALGLAKCREAIASDEAKILWLERQLSEYPMLADVGKQLMVSGRRAETKA